MAEWFSEYGYLIAVFFVVLVEYNLLFCFLFQLIGSIYQYIFVYYHPILEK